MTEAERRVYEATRIPVAIYSYRDGKVITDLVSDGYCEMVGMERERITSLLDSSMFGRVHPDDAGRLASIGQQFALKQSGYDVLYRTRLKGSKEYSFLHTVGRWQKMEDGTEGAVLVYTDVSESISVIENLNIESDSTNGRDIKTTILANSDIRILLQMKENELPKEGHLQGLRLHTATTTNA